jgi:heavy metal translocating P-type ATPase
MGEALAGVIIALMVASGDALEQFARHRAQRDLSNLLSLAPRVAHRSHGGDVEDVPADAVVPRDVLLVRTGEVLPVDGVALDPAVLDESVLTGESVPVDRAVGQRVPSGAVNAGAAFHMRASASAADSAYEGIVRLVRGAQVDRAPFVRLADRYAVVFVPVVLALAGMAWALSGSSVRALAVLVVATPCPLVLGVPVAMVSGISRAARNGVVVKDGIALEALADVRTLLFDKTGTLTTGRPRVIEVATAPDRAADDVLRLAASVEQASPHIFAAAIVAEARDRGLGLDDPGAVEERAGVGVTGRVAGHTVTAGAPRRVVPDAAPAWMASALRRAARDGFSAVAVCLDGEPAAVVLLADQLRTDTPRAVRSLRRLGVDRVVMVSGDRLDVAEPIGRSVGADRVYAERSPAEKVEVVREESAHRPGTTVMVGDGVNDAPALAAAGLGVALGARGATASSEAADVVLLVDRLDRLATGVTIAQRARSVATQTVLLGMGLSFGGMALATAGLLTPVAGAIAQEVIDVAAIGNALRVLRRPAGERRRRPVPEAWTRQLGSGHARLRLVLDEVRAVADVLSDGTAPATVDALRRLTGRLEDTVVAHELVDETQVYPELAERLGGDDPLATMSREHLEIFHLVDLLGRLVAGADHGLDAAERNEARRILYALDAIVRLHLAQEEELLLALSPEPAPAPRDRSSAAPFGPGAGGQGRSATSSPTP